MAARRVPKTLTRTLFDAALPSGAGRPLGQQLREVMKQACELVGASYGGLVLHDPSGEQPSDHIHVGLSDDATPQLAAELQGTVPGYRASHGKCVLQVPIQLGSAIFGAVYMGDKYSGAEFSEADEQLIK